MLIWSFKEQQYLYNGQHLWTLFRSDVFASDRSWVLNPNEMLKLEKYTRQVKKHQTPFSAKKRDMISFSLPEYWLSLKHTQKLKNYLQFIQESFESFSIDALAHGMSAFTKDANIKNLKKYSKKYLFLKKCMDSSGWPISFKGYISSFRKEIYSKDWFESDRINYGYICKEYQKS